MEPKNKLLIYFCVILLLLPVQIACLLTDIEDNNPIGNKQNPNHLKTLAFEQTKQQEQSATMTPMEVTATATSVEDNAIEGSWQGTAQWLCDDNPVWTLTMSFQANGSVSATLSGPGDTTTSQGSWTLDGNEIQIQFNTNYWYGTLSENKIDGFFEEDECSGVWNLKK